MLAYVPKLWSKVRLLRYITIEGQIMNRLLLIHKEKVL